MSVEPKVPVSLDEEFAQIEKENINAGIEEGESTPPVETPPEKKEEETPPPPEVTPPEKDDDEDDEPPAPKPTEGDEPPEKKEDTPDLDTSQHRRPARYIPIPQYKEEKASWEAEKSKLENDLRTALENKGKDGDEPKAPTTPQEKNTVTQKIQAYAESRGMEVAEVQELADTLKEAIFGGNFEKFNQILETQEKNEQEKKLDEEDARVFGEQFTANVAPILKEIYPTATEAQLAAMRSHMDMLGHTLKLAQTPLEYIFHGHRKEFDALVAGEEAPVVEKPVGRSALGGRSGAGKGIGANDFVGKTDFSDLLKLPEDQQNAIMRDMDMKTYDAFTKYVADTDRDTLVVQRNGRKVVLK